MHRILKITLYFLGGILLLIIVAFLLISIYANSLKGDLEQAITTETGFETHIRGAISVTYFPTFHLNIRRVEIRGNHAPFIQVGKIELAVKYQSIFEKQYVIEQLRLISPDVKVLRDSLGNYNYELDDATLGTSDKNISHESIDYERISLKLNRVQVVVGNFLYLDKKYDDTIVIRNVNLESKAISYSVRLDSLNLSQLDFEGLLAIDSFRLNHWYQNDIHLLTNCKGGKIGVKPRADSLYGGRLIGNILADYSSTTPKYQFNYTIEQCFADSLFSELSPDPVLSGRIDMEISMGFQSHRAKQIRSSLNGSVSIEGDSLELHGVDLDKVLKKFEKSQKFTLVDVGAVFVAGPVGALFTKSMNFASLLTVKRGEKSFVNRFISNWEINHGIIHAEDVAFSTHKYRVAVLGGMDVVNRQYSDLTIAVLDKDGCATLSERIYGSFDEPQTESINAFQAVMGPVKNLWKRLTSPVRKKKCKLSYQGSVVHPG